MNQGTFLERSADLFVPSERNKQLPYLLSPAIASAYLMVALVLLLVPSYLRVTQLASLTQPSSFSKDQMIALTNQARAVAGVPTLTVSTVLEATAAAKAEDMFSNQYFAHASPSGKLPWDFLKASNYKYLAAGENLATDFAQAESAQAAFMASPTHRENILNPAYTEVGIIVAQGQLNGHDSIIVVEYFGKPKPTTVATTKPTPTPARNPKPGTPSKPAPKPVPVPKSSSTAEPVGATSTSRSTSVVSTITITPSSTPEVLGTTKNQPTTKLEAVGEKILVVKSYVPEYVKVKVLALLLMCSLLIALAFLAKRMGHIPGHVMVRTLVLLVMLGYAATFGVRDWHTATLTPTSASTISVIQ